MTSVIINLQDNLHSLEGNCIPANKRPSYLHTDDEAAERELLRLQKCYPDGEFVLFKAVKRAVSIESPTVVNIHGTSLAYQKTFQVVPIIDDSVPF